MKPFLFEHIGPFFGFQGNTVGSGESGGDESDVMNLAEGNVHGHTCKYEKRQVFQ
jgi:hypothetical protein